jgi:hypothetical protein
MARAGEIITKGMVGRVKGELFDRVDVILVSQLVDTGCRFFTLFFGEKWHLAWPFLTCRGPMCLESRLRAPVRLLNKGYAVFSQYWPCRLTHGRASSIFWPIITPSAMVTRELSTTNCFSFSKYWKSDLNNRSYIA